MDDITRLKKLKEAKKIIREVEFSYPSGDPIRSMIYRIIVESFGLTSIGNLITTLEEKIY